MTIEDLQTICRQLPGVTEDVKWDVHLCFNVGGKMFLVTAPDEVPCTASFKVPVEEFDALSAQPGFKPAPYMARNHWVHLDNIARLGRAQWEQHIRESYRLVAEKLPAKVRKTLAL
ncbi:hypothetical protein F0P96_12640 [Hymenobacter busanensis]|uniref:Uncharacterized protein n=1 Tax=Hymenobacter busanensis TaxID=2607656 RepID=A0A7L4ZV85_9BACT|nr:MmcQ/YjbR family DNA-binding protein [Hymenobacter busanensis]KAA9332319.1 hypothetical protein F0P96_12640 [Hymenobacter busanensis]QHJ07344.1 hypothetical protein GUY19_08635 [Hymenobacter busanensis]